ncbi:MAG: hypothetical protein ACI9X4_002584 [Glaciecola sp.]
MTPLETGSKHDGALRLEPIRSGGAAPSPCFSPVFHESPLAGSCWSHFGRSLRNPLRVHVLMGVIIP